ncbi:DUF547 domain-containing protein [Nonlabens sp. Asnod2-A12]|uniref:DUF547 domain-containing protein n=1 Tax=Nonlabens sp. Asnod2-A12 TaxID=3160578 RepID=UPI00386C8091
MKNQLYSFLIILLIASTGTAQNLSSFHNKLDSFLGKHVKSGKVDYSAIHADRSELDQLVSLSQEIRVKTSSASDFQAFWINAYNLHVIKGLVDNYPISSPLDKSGFFDKTKYSIAGENITLNDIENKMLRAKFKDARFHFVLVCGAVGCPPLISKAYLPATLNAQLEQQTKLAINNDKFIKPGKKVAVSQIFEWYKADFEQDGKTLDFINKYRKEPFAAKTKITYYPYNWKINKK